MRSLVTNWGPTREFPTCIGNVHIAARETREVTGDLALIELGKFPMLTIEVQEPAEGEKPRPRTQDYRKLKINELRSLAARRKTKANFMHMRKADLISLLEEQHG
jgi:hypothetical protein